MTRHLTEMMHADNDQILNVLCLFTNLTAMSWQSISLFNGDSKRQVSTTATDSEFGSTGDLQTVKSGVNLKVF